MTEPDEPAADDDDTGPGGGASPLPVPDPRGGRPTQLTAERVATFLDEHEAAHGTLPSVRQMQEALGGGRTKLVALRDQVRAERLVATAAPDGSAVATALARAVGAALEMIGLEAARGAERTIEAVRAEADSRAEAAERVRVRAERVEAEAALERERAVGRAAALEAELEALRADRRAVERDLGAALERERALETTAATLRAELAEQRGEAARAEATVARLGRESDEQAAALERLSEERETAARRGAELEIVLARAEAERDGACLRAEESVARAQRAEAALADANARAERAEAVLEDANVRVEQAEAAHAGANARAERAEAKRDIEAEQRERVYAALAAERRTAVGICHAHIKRLTAALVEAEVPVPELEVLLPEVEIQPSPALDDDEHADQSEDPRQPTS